MLVVGWQQVLQELPRGAVDDGEQDSAGSLPQAVPEAEQQHHAVGVGGPEEVVVVRAGAVVWSA